LKSNLTLAVLATALSVTAIAPETAHARRTYAHNGSTAHRCSGGKGVVGTVVGGVGGAVAGGAIIGGPVAVIAGGVGGALLGRHIDKKNVRRRHGCR
jgi:uncharacterized protein YcfJ